MKNYGKIDEGKDLVDRDYADGKAPKVHSSPANEYGAATGQKFGHVMLVDQITNIGASAGRAASPYSVKLAFDKAVEATSKVWRLDTAQVAIIEDSLDTFGGDHLNYRVYHFNCPGVTADTQLSDIQLASDFVGNAAAEKAVAEWDYIETANDEICIHFQGKSSPSSDFAIIVREVN